MRRIKIESSSEPVENVDSSEYKPKTELGAKLIALRKKIIADPKQRLNDRQLQQYMKELRN